MGDPAGEGNVWQLWSHVNETAWASKKRFVPISILTYASTTTFVFITAGPRIPQLIWPVTKLAVGFWKVYLKGKKVSQLWTCSNLRHFSLCCPAIFKVDCVLVSACLHVCTYMCIIPCTFCRSCVVWMLGSTRRGVWEHRSSLYAKPLCPAPDVSPYLLTHIITSAT